MKRGGGVIWTSAGDKSSTKLDQGWGTGCGSGLILTLLPGFDPREKTRSGSDRILVINDKNG